MLSYQLTLDAQEDLHKIRHYTLQKWGKAQALVYLKNLQNAIRGLCEFPLQGILRPEVSEGVRSFPIANHVIYYFITEKHVIIFAILHERMAPLEHLQGRAQ